MGTMSGGRFYGPSAMSSVSSSRMNKILQDVSRFLRIRIVSLRALLEQVTKSEVLTLTGLFPSSFFPKFPTTSIGTASLSLPLPPIPSSLPSSSTSAHQSHPTPSSGRHRLYPPGSLPQSFESAMDVLDESGISMENIISLLDKLPDRGTRNALVELYWREIECVCLPITFFWRLKD